MKNNKKKKSCYDKNIMLLQGKYHVITKEKSCYNEKRLCENIKLLHDNITLLQGKYVMWNYNMIRKKSTLLEEKAHAIIWKYHIMKKIMLLQKKSH